MTYHNMSDKATITNALDVNNYIHANCLLTIRDLCDDDATTKAIKHLKVT